MNVADKIYEIVKTMPEEKAEQILDFVEFLHHKSSLSAPKEIQLKPLRILHGYIPPGWKEAIYEQGS